MEHIGDPPPTSIKPCPDPAHTLCFRTFHRQSHCFSAPQFVSATTSLLSKLASTGNTASEHLNLLPQQHRFRASQLASAATPLPSISVASEQLRFRTTLLPSTAASVATSLPGEPTTFASIVTTLVPINGSATSLSGETFTILSDCRHIGLTRSLPLKATTLVPINDVMVWFDVDTYDSSQRCLYGIRFIIGKDGKCQVMSNLPPIPTRYPGLMCTWTSLAIMKTWLMH